MSPLRNEQIRILLERQKEQILVVGRAEIQKHEFQADYDGVFKKLNRVIEFQRREIDRTIASDDQQLLHEQLLKQNWDLREAHEKSLHEIIYREPFFANPTASSSSHCPGGFDEPWFSNVTEDTLGVTSTKRPVACGERQIPDTVLTPRSQSWPSAGNSTLRNGDSWKIIP